MKYLNHNFFLMILFVALVIRIVFLPGFHELWWDSGVYAGMGKHIFSGGSAGLWEHIRPPLWPVFLGSFWALGLDMLAVGRIFELMFSVGCIVLLYQIARHYFNERVALLSAAIFSFSSIFFFLNFHIYSEIPALFFVLLSVYLFISNRLFLSGFSVALAFLSKFPAGMFIAVICFALLLDKNFRGLLKLIAGFAVPVLPVLLLYQIYYGSPFLPFIEARQTIAAVLGCNVLRYQPWWHYLQLILSENFLHIFSVVGLIAYFGAFGKKKLVPLLLLAVPLVYFSQLHCRDYRYLALFIPFVALFTAHGISQALEKQSKRVFIAALFVVLGVSLFQGVLFYLGNENMIYNDTSGGYFAYLKDVPVKGEVWISDPTVAFFTDAKLHKIYYPVYDADVSIAFNDYLQKNAGNVEYVLLDNCGGGIICEQGDSRCEGQNSNMLDFLGKNFKPVYNQTRGRCWYLIFKN